MPPASVSAGSDPSCGAAVWKDIESDSRAVMVALEPPPRTFASWPAHNKAEVQVMPGGFLNCSLPAAVPLTPRWKTDPKDLKRLIKTEEPREREVFTNEVPHRAQREIESNTVGMDRFVFLICMPS